MSERSKEKRRNAEISPLHRTMKLRGSGRNDSSYIFWTGSKGFGNLSTSHAVGCPPNQLEPKQRQSEIQGSFATLKDDDEEQATAKMICRTKATTKTNTKVLPLRYARGQDDGEEQATAKMWGCRRAF
jgi:hypothetical protein